MRKKDTGMALFDLSFCGASEAYEVSRSRFGCRLHLATGACEEWLI